MICKSERNFFGRQVDDSGWVEGDGGSAWGGRGLTDEPARRRTP